ncbi:hypothetical protein MT499_003190 [Salmonella enterica]|nr:hypothetical protein [Salmonella enterica]
MAASARPLLKNNITINLHIVNYICIVICIDNKRIVVRCKTFRWPAIRQTRVRMIDFARKPARQQAVPLNRIEVLIRRLCYLLAQKGDPDA